MISFVPAPSAVNRTISARQLYGVAILDESFKPMPIEWWNGDGFSSAHRADSHAKPKRGIPNGT
jgi:hypothetical protein